MALPSNYKRLQYIESTGTQYIDTGFKPNQKSKVEIDFQFTFTTTPSAQKAPFGARNSNTAQLWAYYRYNDSTYSGRFAAMASQASFSVAPGERVFNSLSSSGYRLDDLTKLVTSATFTSSYNLYLFGVNNAGALQYPSEMKLYSCAVYDDGTQVREYVPCINESGIVGLFDMMNGVFYTDAAGGAFVAGPEVTLDSLLTDIADAIRSKTENGLPVIAGRFPTEIRKLATLLNGTSDATATAADINTGKTAYINGVRVTGTGTMTVKHAWTKYSVTRTTTGTVFLPRITTFSDWDISMDGSTYTYVSKKSDITFDYSSGRYVLNNCTTSKVSSTYTLLGKYVLMSGEVYSNGTAESEIINYFSSCDDYGEDEDGYTVGIYSGSYYRQKSASASSYPNGFFRIGSSQGTVTTTDENMPDATLGYTYCCDWTDSWTNIKYTIMTNGSTYYAYYKNS